MCDKAAEGDLLGIKPDFCTLKPEQIKNNRTLFLLQRETFSSSSIFPDSPFSLQLVKLGTVTHAVQSPAHTHPAVQPQRAAPYRLRTRVWMEIRIFPGLAASKISNVNFGKT